MTSLAVLTFEPQEVMGGDDGAVRFLDFVVDGVSLSELFPVAAAVSATPFGGWRRETLQRYFGWLMGDEVSDMPSGRVPLYVCSYCGDCDCGTFVARVSVDDERITWSEFSREVTYAIDVEGDMDETYPEIAPITFNKRRYREAIEAALHQC